MLLASLKRLFRGRRSRHSTAPSTTPHGADTASHPTQVHDALPAAITATSDWSAEWRQRLNEADALLRAHPIASQQPDAAALLQLLADGPDTVIRQLPVAARQAMALCDDTSLSRSQLATRLAGDPALVQHLLRTANSAAFGVGRGEVLAIDEALGRIGVTGTRAVILSSCVDGLLSHPGGDFNVMAIEVWQHMVRTAPLARVIAPAFAADPDEAFAVALLHDVGKLVVFDRLSVLRASRRRPVQIDGTFAHTLLQLVHEPLGALAAERWGMGPRAATAIGTHHRQTRDPLRVPLAEVVYLAEQADHAERRNVPLDLDAAWTAGHLTGSPARAAAALQTLSSVA
jgi:HD-like signal output (HDOD) protein